MNIIILRNGDGNINENITELYNITFEIRLSITNDFAIGIISLSIMMKT